MRQEIKRYATRSGRLLARPLLAMGLATCLVAAAAPDDGARDRAAEFVRATGVANGDTPVARWVTPVCPRVLGLRQDAARVAENKMRAIAAEAGIPVAGADCDTNIVVSVVADAAAVAREIHRLAPLRLAELSPGQREALLRGSAPVRWWHESELRNARGGALQDGGGPATTSAGAHVGPGYGAGGSLGGGTMMHYTSSILSTLTERSLSAATVIIDQNAVMGMPLDAVASYAAMVAFAEIREADAAPAGSILSAFTSGRPPRNPTAQDMAFLRALYTIPLDRRAMTHRAALAGAMASND